MHALGIEALVVGHLEQCVKNVTADLGRTRLSGDAEMIAAACDFYVEAAFDLPQVLIELTAKIGQTSIVGGLENYVPRYLDCIQDWCFRPLKVFWSAYREDGGMGRVQITPASGRHLVVGQAAPQ